MGEWLVSQTVDLRAALKAELRAAQWDGSSDDPQVEQSVVQWADRWVDPRAVLRVARRAEHWVDSWVEQCFCMSVDSSAGRWAASKAGPWVACWVDPMVAKKVVHWVF